MHIFPHCTYNYFLIQDIFYLAINSVMVFFSRMRTNCEEYSFEKYANDGCDLDSLVLPLTLILNCLYHYCGRCLRQSNQVVDLNQSSLIGPVQFFVQGRDFGLKSWGTDLFSTFAFRMETISGKAQ